MAKGSPDIEVVKAEPGRVEIRILSVHFVFAYDGQVIRIVSKFKPDSQVYDPKVLSVPTGLFNKACRQAAAILKERQTPLAASRQIS